MTPASQSIPTKDRFGHPLLFHSFYQKIHFSLLLLPTLFPKEIRIRTFLPAFFKVSPNSRPKSLVLLTTLSTLIAICTIHANFSDWVEIGFSLKVSSSVPCPLKQKPISMQQINSTQESIVKLSTYLIEYAGKLKYRSFQTKVYWRE